MTDSFQSFEDPTPDRPSAEKLAALREEMRAEGLDGFLVPHADEFQSEDVPPASRRLAWLTGFTGSAGAAVVLCERAAVFVDGRYTLQAASQVDGESFEIASLIETPPADWLKTAGLESARIGFDPNLHSLAGTKQLREKLAASDSELIAVENLVDRIWSDRPAPPLGPVVPQPVRFTGETATEKLARVRIALAEAGVDASYTNQADIIAWMLNVRGSDTARMPAPLAYLLLPAEGRGTLFVDAEKLTDEARDHLVPLVDLAPVSARSEALEALGGGTVLIDPRSATEAMRAAIEAAGATAKSETDPAVLMKAVKTEAELAGARAAHVRDGAALCRFLAWLDETAPGGGVDEIGAAEALEGFRRETGLLKDLSFDTISGAGPNGAIVHYRVTRSTNAPLETGSLYLVDSGGQYQDGTTDITRTVAIGEPSEEMCDRFTRVLKGHIAIATARFPEGTTGAQLDTLARHALWQAGLDYAHGTGHGVGSYLGVHEGPQSLSKRGTVALKAGMIVSNEPGYYKTGAYGIRIENLEVVREAEPIADGDVPMHGFETLTLAPIDRRLVQPDLLTKAERHWLNAYHARVRDEIGPHLPDDVRIWLERATEPV
ncbi:MAG: aminopeptidase P family protein [Pseudomonadota bacterium]